MRRDPVLHFLAMCVICLAAILAFCSCSNETLNPAPEPPPEEEMADAGADGPVHADASKF